MIAVFLRPDFIPAGVITRSSPFASRSTRDVSFTAKPHQLIIRHRRLCPKSKRGGRSSRVKFIPVVYSQRLDPAPHHGYPHTIMQEHPSGLSHDIISELRTRAPSRSPELPLALQPLPRGRGSTFHHRRFTGRKDRDRLQRRKRFLSPHHLCGAISHRRRRRAPWPCNQAPCRRRSQPQSRRLHALRCLPPDYPRVQHA